MTDLFSLAGRRALVTGARAGIGRAIAVAFARAGAELVVHGHHDDLHETVAMVEAAGGRCETWVRDLRDRAAVRADLDRLCARPIDVLVNNAGVVVRDPQPAERADFGGYRDTMAVNVDAVLQLSQLVGTRMIDRGSGKIILLASMLSFQGGRQRLGYAVSKHAVLGLTRALSNEWAGRNVQVNALAPGYIATERPAPIIGDPAVLARIPAGRWGVPADLAGPAVFLASAASDYVTGHVLAADGGWLAG